MSQFIPPRADYRELITKLFAQVGYHQTMQLTLDKLEPGVALVSMPISDRVNQHLGTVHAGAVIGLADSAVGSAAATLLEADESIVSSNFSVALMRPGLGKRLTARGEVIKRGKRLIFCEGRVFGDNGELIAQVGVTMAVIPAG